MKHNEYLPIGGGELCLFFDGICPPTRNVKKSSSKATAGVGGFLRVLFQGVFVLFCFYAGCNPGFLLFTRKHPKSSGRHHWFSNGWPKTELKWDLNPLAL